MTLRLTRSRAAVVVIVAAVALGVAGGLLVHTLRAASPPKAAPGLPAFHGQASWRRGARPAPAFALTDQTGKRVTLRSLRGRSVLLTFLDSQCKSSCPIEGRQIGAIMRALPPAARPQLVVISVDHAGDTPRGVAAALRKWRLTGAWNVHWLNAPTRAGLAAVWKSYGVQVVPTTNDVVHSLALYLIDRHGFERTAYLFPFLPGFVQRDLGRLATA